MGGLLQREGVKVQNSLALLSARDGLSAPGDPQGRRQIAPVAQRIVYRSPKPVMWVRFPPGAPVFVVADATDFAWLRPSAGKPDEEEERRRRLPGKVAAPAARRPALTLTAYGHDSRRTARLSRFGSSLLAQRTSPGFARQPNCGRPLTLECGLMRPPFAVPPDCGASSKPRVSIHRSRPQGRDCCREAILEFPRLRRCRVTAGRAENSESGRTGWRLILLATHFGES